MRWLVDDDDIFHKGEAPLEMPVIAAGNNSLDYDSDTT